MSRPTHNQIAASLGVAPNQVNPLVNRGMPTATLLQAQQWFAQHGWRYVARRAKAQWLGGL